MISSIFKFTIGLMALIVFLLPLNYFVLEEFLKVPFGILNYLSFGYFLMIVFGIQIYILRLLKDRPQKFVTGFMAAMGIKIFLSLIILTLMLYFGGVDKKVMGVNFASLYLIFTTFSVVQILKAQRASVEGEK